MSFWLDTESGQAILTEGSDEEILLDGFAPIPGGYPGPMQNIIPAYLYQEYVDDDDLQYFVNSLNTLSQQYLTWFNSTPLAVYTSPNITGPLLDWIAQGIYGLTRPVFSSETTKFIAGIATLPIGTYPISGKKFFESGTATIATDDFYKRYLTWWLYCGDGRYFNVEWLRLRVARFLYGVNGTDITLTQAQTVRIQPQNVPSPPAPVLSTTTTILITSESGIIITGDGDGGTEVTSESPATGVHSYIAWLTYVNQFGETKLGPSSMLAVGSGQVLVVASPPAANGALDYNVYAALFSANPAKFKGAIATMPTGYGPIGGNNKRGQSPPTLQNASPIVIGLPWVEPVSGLVAGRGAPKANTTNFPGNFIITVPPGTASTLFQQAFEQGILNFPFTYTGTVVIS